MDWMKSTHIMKSNLLYSKSNVLNCNLIHKYLYRNIQNDIQLNICALWLSQVDTKMNNSSWPITCFGPWNGESVEFQQALLSSINFLGIFPSPM